VFKHIERAVEGGCMTNIDHVARIYEEFLLSGQICYRDALLQRLKREGVQEEEAGASIDDFCRRRGVDLHPGYTKGQETFLVGFIVVVGLLIFLIIDVATHPSSLELVERVVVWTTSVIIIVVATTAFVRRRLPRPSSADPGARGTSD
jgi:hypothetical protein